MKGFKTSVLLIIIIIIIYYLYSPVKPLSYYCFTFLTLNHNSNMAAPRKG